MTLHEINLMLAYHPYVGLQYLILGNIILAETGDCVCLSGGGYTFSNISFTASYTTTGERVDIIDNTTQLKVAFNGKIYTDIIELEKAWNELTEPLCKKDEEAEFELLTI